MILRNKKGADSTMGPMIWLIVILIVAALVIFFVAGGFDKISGLFEQAPGTLTAAVSVCKSITVPSTFCEQLRYVSINGESQYVNCAYPPVYDQLELTSEVRCDEPADSAAGKNYRDWSAYFCSGLFREGKVKSETKANGVYCSSLSCSDIAGTEISIGDSAVKCPDNQPKKITKGLSDSATQACCI